MRALAPSRCSRESHMLERPPRRLTPGQAAEPWWGSLMTLRTAKPAVRAVLRWAGRCIPGAISTCVRRRARDSKADGGPANGGGETERTERPWQCLGGAPLMNPLIFKCYSINGIKHRDFEQHSAEAFDQRPQSWLWHHRDEFVEHGSLTKQRMRALFGGVGFEMTVISESLTQLRAMSARQRQKHSAAKAGPVFPAC